MREWGGVSYIATISGGKDSVADCDLLLKNGYPVDYIVFTDTLLELSLMYDYIEKLKKYFFERYGKEIIVLKPTTTFEEWAFGVIRDKNADYYGAIRGIPMAWSEPCFWRRESKNYPMERWLKEKDLHEMKEKKKKGKIVTPYRAKQYKIYIGFTLDESSRKMKGDEFLYPLIDNFKMTERNCQEYLINQEMENPLYKFFTRTGCGVCPAQSDRAFYQIWKNFPNDWAYMEFVEQRLLHYKRLGLEVRNPYWFVGHKTCKDMEKMFLRQEKQSSLMDFSDEPLKDCFCKI